jgi:hypothetical protein
MVLRGRISDADAIPERSAWILAKDPWGKKALGGLHLTLIPAGAGTLYRKRQSVARSCYASEALTASTRPG